MIILDTDVFSAGMKGRDEVAITWLNNQPGQSFHITSITLFEVVAGIRSHPDPVQRKSLAAALAHASSRLLNERILPLDESAARVAGELAGARRRAGRTIGAADSQIAAIATLHGATLATRNVKHFADLSIAVVNPWEA